MFDKNKFTLSLDNLTPANKRLLRARRMLADTTNKKYWGIDSASWRKPSISSDESKIVMRCMDPTKKLLEHICPVLFSDFVTVYTSDDVKDAIGIPTESMSKLDKRLERIYDDFVRKHVGSNLTDHIKNPDGLTVEASRACGDTLGRVLHYADVFTSNVHGTQFKSHSDGRVHIIDISAFNIGVDPFERGNDISMMHEADPTTDNVANFVMVNDVPLPNEDIDDRDFIHAVYDVRFSNSAARRLDTIGRIGFDAFILVDAYLHFCGEGMINDLKSWIRKSISTYGLFLEKNKKGDPGSSTTIPLSMNELFMSVPISRFYQRYHGDSSYFYDDIRRYVSTTKFAKALRDGGVKGFSARSSAAEVTKSEGKYYLPVGR